MARKMDQTGEVNCGEVAGQYIVGGDTKLMGDKYYFSESVQIHLSVDSQSLMIGMFSYFVNKGPSSQGYSFSSGHVWM